MIGQTKLVKKINSYTIDTLPQNLLFIGEDGCGKHLLANELARNLKLPTVDVVSEMAKYKASSDPDRLSALLVDSVQSQVTSLYLIDLDLLDENLQNILLKFIEEPTDNIYIVLMSSSEVNVIPTILNRCIKMYFEEYKVDELKAFNGGLFGEADNEAIFEICKTPGQVLEALNSTDMNKLLDLCNNIVNRAATTSYANMLSIETKINYKEEYDKFDFNLFFKTMIYASYKSFVSTNNETSGKIYLFTAGYYNEYIKKMAKEAFMINYLTKLWKVVRA